MGSATTGLLAGLLFGPATIGFPGGILGRAEGGFLIWAAATALLGRLPQSSIRALWLAAFDRVVLTASSIV